MISLMFYLTRIGCVISRKNTENKTKEKKKTRTPHNVVHFWNEVCAYFLFSSIIYSIPFQNKKKKRRQQFFSLMQNERIIFFNSFEKVVFLFFLFNKKYIINSVFMMRKLIAFNRNIMTCMIFIALRKSLK
jgi:hypothetical protein